MKASSVHIRLQYSAVHKSEATAKIYYLNSNIKDLAQLCTFMLDSNMAFYSLNKADPKWSQWTPLGRSGRNSSDWKGNRVKRPRFAKAPKAWKEDHRI